MCGIFGFVSKLPKQSSIILNGLKELEYRGYDSWGIAVKKDNRIIADKNTGKIGGATTALPDSVLGIGHTRWATHGGVTKENAHPHIDCTGQLALAHNGIFENYEVVKQYLARKGHKFVSQTDTEIIIHLIEEELKSSGFATAVRHAFLKMDGLNAIVVINAKSKEIIAAKSGSPLLVGVTKDTSYVASDISAIAPHTNKAIVLKDNQMAVLGEKIQLIDIKSGKIVKNVIEVFEKGGETSSKGSFDHFILKEIHDQTKILSSIYDLEYRNAKNLADHVKKAFGTYMLGCGTASYAAMAGEYYLSMIAKKHVNFSVGSEFKYMQDFITNKSLIIPISQSGETIDVVEPVQDAKNKGATIYSVVNVPTSSLARMSDFSLYLHAGQERAVVGTKSFTSMVAVLLMVAYSANGKLNEAKNLLSQTSKDISNILSPNRTKLVKNLAKKLKKKNNAFLIGRGVSYVAALEGALKLKETSLVHAEGFAGGELKHGVIALIEEGTPCFVFAPNDETYPEIISNAQEIKARGGYIIGIGPNNNGVFDEFLQTSDLGPATLISQTVYMQLLAYYLALERGIEDPDKPRNLAKSVTVK